MDDIYLIRRKNLAAVCREKVGGNQSELARALEMVPNLVNRYLKSKRMGDDVAQLVEKTYGLAAGWMDNVHPSDREALVLMAYRNASQEIQTAVERILNLPFTQTSTLSGSKRRSA
jgi:predicted transcriptional regulator